MPFPGEGPFPLFSKKGTKSPILWYYYGLYSVHRAADLTIEEYLALDLGVSGLGVSA